MTGIFNTLGQLGHYTNFGYCLKSLITLRPKLPPICSFTLIFASMKRQGQEKVKCEYCGKAFKLQGLGTHKRMIHGEVVLERKVVKTRIGLEEKLPVKLKVLEPVKLSTGGSLGSSTKSFSRKSSNSFLDELDYKEIDRIDKSIKSMHTAWEVFKRQMEREGTTGHSDCPSIKMQQCQERITELMTQKAVLVKKNTSS